MVGRYRVPNFRSVGLALKSIGRPRGRVCGPGGYAGPRFGVNPGLGSSLDVFADRFWKVLGNQQVGKEVRVALPDVRIGVQLGHGVVAWVQPYGALARSGGHHHVGSGMGSGARLGGALSLRRSAPGAQHYYKEVKGRHG